MKKDVINALPHRPDGPLPRCSLCLSSDRVCNRCQSLLTRLGTRKASFLLCIPAADDAFCSWGVSRALPPLLAPVSVPHSVMTHLGFPTPPTATFHPPSPAMRVAHAQRRTQRAPPSPPPQLAPHPTSPQRLEVSAAAGTLLQPTTPGRRPHTGAHGEGEWQRRLPPPTVSPQRFSLSPHRRPSCRLCLFLRRPPIMTLVPGRRAQEACVGLSHVFWRAPLAPLFFSTSLRKHAGLAATSRRE